MADIPQEMIASEPARSAGVSPAVLLALAISTAPGLKKAQPAGRRRSGTRGEVGRVPTGSRHAWAEPV